MKQDNISTFYLNNKKAMSSSLPTRTSSSSSSSSSSSTPPPSKRRKPKNSSKTTTQPQQQHKHKRSLQTTRDENYNREDEDVVCLEFFLPLLPPCTHCGRTDEPITHGPASTYSPPPPPWHSTPPISKPYLVPTPYKPITVTNPAAGVMASLEIVDTRNANVAEKYARSISTGVPFVLTGPGTRSLCEFAKDWISYSPTTGQPEFNQHEFALACGDAIGPISRRGYSGDQLASNETMRVAQYIEKYWHGESVDGVYLAQWQFPLSIPLPTEASLDRPSPLSPTNDEDQQHRGMKDIQWGLSTVPSEIMGADLLTMANLGTTMGMNPYQYLFIGSQATESTMHIDKGGFTILVTSLIGEKQFTLVHRDDSAYVKVGDEYSIDPVVRPLGRVARMWQHCLVPGDVLVMPPRTIHAVFNATAAISYSRCHLGPCEMWEWLQSHMARDAQEMRHAQIIHECANYYIKKYDDEKSRDEEEVRVLEPQDVDAICCLRDAAVVLSHTAKGDAMDQHDVDTGDMATHTWETEARNLDALLPYNMQKYQVALSHVVNGLVDHGDATTTTTTTTTVSSTKNRKRSILSAGDVVTLRPGVALGKRAGKRAVVVKVIPAARVIPVKFQGFNKTAELVLLSNVRAKSVKGHTPLIKEGCHVQVEWKVTDEVFDGEVMESPTIQDVVEVQFNKLGVEWNQIVAINDIVRLTGGMKVEVM